MACVGDSGGYRWKLLALLPRKEKILSLRDTFPNEDINSKIELLGGTNPIVVWIVATINIVLLLLVVSPFVTLFSLRFLK